MKGIKLVQGGVNGPRGIFRGPETMEVLDRSNAHFFAVPIRRDPLRTFYLVVDWCRADSSGN